jgi:hypothetical protein
VTESFTPALLPVLGGDSPWQTGLGFALGPVSTPDGLGAAQGWMPIELPHGTNIESMVVSGRRPVAVQTWAIALRRIELTSRELSLVCGGEIQKAPLGQNSSFSASVKPENEQLTPTQAAERRRVDTTKYRYLFDTSMDGAAQVNAIELWTVQVTCTRG